MILSKERPQHVEGDSRRSVMSPSYSSISFQGRPPANLRFGDVFPCENPTSPIYGEYTSRLQTFKNWTKGHVMKAGELADAGLYYLGERDRCKCFYCNGGLQNWQSGDNAMEEHAKYFPQCEFVLARMGPDYVAELNAKYPSLKRPTVPVSYHQTNHEMLHQARNVPNHAAQPPSTHVQSKIQTQVRADDMETLTLVNQLASQAVQFGYNKRTVDTVISRKRESDGHYHSSLSQLIDDLIRNERGDIFGNDSMEVEYDGPGMSTVPAVTVDKPSNLKVGSGNKIESDSLRDQLQSAIDETLCRSCYKRNRDCVFLDCGHLCCCYECGEAKKECVICNTRVTKVIKIFKM